MSAPRPNRLGEIGFGQDLCSSSSSLVLTGATRENDCRNGPQHNRHVETQRPAIDVLQIQMHPLLEGKIAAAGNLPEASQPGLHTEATLLPGLFHPNRIANRQRARANDAHIAQQDIDQLRQLIDARAPQPLPDSSNSRVVLDFEDRPTLLVQVLDVLHARFGIDTHRPEFEHAKTPLAQTNALLYEEDGSGRI